MIVLSSFYAFAEVKPGPPEGSRCVTALNDEGTSIRRNDGTWSCKVKSSIANAPNGPVGTNPTLLTPGVLPPFVYPTCPVGWLVTIKAGRDLCTAPVPPSPSCPPGKVLTQDQDAMKDVCKHQTIGGPATSAPRPVS